MDRILVALIPYGSGDTVIRSLEEHLYWMFFNNRVASSVCNCHSAIDKNNKFGLTIDPVRLNQVLHLRFTDATILSTKGVNLSGAFWNINTIQELKFIISAYSNCPEKNLRDQIL
jgi:hypothetical protein